ncbi:hypothetical protein OROHE_003520 [Orobanche hederae]
MATEHHQADAQISTAPPPVPTISTAHFLDPYPIDHPTTATANPPKRQRRPSVRLGEIGGDPPYDSQQRRPNKTWRFHGDPSFAAKTSKTRPVTNLVNGGGEDLNFVDSVELSENYVSFTHRKSKIKRKPTRRARTNWNKIDSTIINNGVGGGGAAGITESTDVFLPEEGTENNNLELRVSEAEGSESLLLKQQQSPINSEENMGLQFWDQHRRGSRTPVSDSNGAHHHHHLNEVNSAEKNSEWSVGVREWLIGLGLGRYAPVFEIHEVDDEVLPMLTLEDLKDMGINAVGSRRKMYSGIVKLRKRKGFS